MESISILSLLFVVVIICAVVCVWKVKSSFIELLSWILYPFSWGIWLLVLCSSDYNIAVEYGDMYTPLASWHLPTIFFYTVTGHVALLTLRIRKHNLPPLLFVICMAFLLIYMTINAFVLIQVFGIWDIIDLLGYSQPILAQLLCIICLVKVCRDAGTYARQRNYRNRLLRAMNDIIIKHYSAEIWICILILPLLLLCTLVLMLFGQSPDALCKAFTDTTTWTLSQKVHPPYLEPSGGHYLCTVAAFGAPKLVKPLFVGRRHGHPIIVNRQLQVANAFESILENVSPALHRIVRAWYDRYGLDLSHRINNRLFSNLTYILMKPLEYFFVICLYLYYIHPEQIISRQYQTS